MSEEDAEQTVSTEVKPALEGGTYEIIKQRLLKQAGELKKKVQQLDELRKSVFGSVPMALKKAERITTEHNCIPRDMIRAVGDTFIFGYNVQFGLKTSVQISDVFAIFDYKDEAFHPLSLEALKSGQFEQDFANLYKYYKETKFVKFSQIGPFLFMVFRVGKNVTDIKTFKWAIQNGELHYVDNRSDHEFVFPDQYQFEWVRTHRDLHRFGEHPHVSIEDIVFVECIGGDLTIKIEDNTDSGSGILSEEVDFKDQTLDDAEIFFAKIGQIILLKIRPFQEKEFRYFVYNNKLREVHRFDALKDACCILPEGHGVIVPNGYYLINGQIKIYENDLTEMMFERMVSSPNGEDYMYVFYNRLQGNYTILPYNIISQNVDNPIYCNGFSLFKNGELTYFRMDDEPQKHHVAQIWQTPFTLEELNSETDKDHFLYQIGNRDVVRCMAECSEILNLATRDSTYDELYVDLVKRSSDVVESYFWIDNDGLNGIVDCINQIKETSGQAIDEFNKVNRLKKEAIERLKAVETKTKEIFNEISRSEFALIDDFVSRLAELRKIRGEIISLRDVPYVDLERVNTFEETVSSKTLQLSESCVDFLLKEESLNPYRDHVAQLKGSLGNITKVTEGNELVENVSEAGNELEMLIDIVNNLKIEDSTQATRIIDQITEIFTSINQLKVAANKKIKELHGVEGKAQFAAQIRLISQSVVSFLDLCDSPEKCDEYLNKLMVQLEELEGSFADFDEFIIEIADKRTEAYEAFEARKLNLIESRNKKAVSLVSSAERILKVISNRVEGFDSINDINGYLAADLMVEKIRGIIDNLNSLGDSVKADDIQGRLKTIQQDGIRQLKDKKELFQDGENIIRFGKHKFSVNTQDLDLTILSHDGDMCLHLTGTKFFSSIKNPKFLETKDAWAQDIISENRDVYRSEYLGYQVLLWLEQSGSISIEEFLKLNDAERLKTVQDFMAPLYAESYTKGIHDQDSLKILEALTTIYKAQKLARYSPTARACALVYWNLFCPAELKSLWQAKLEAFQEKNTLFPGLQLNTLYVDEIEKLISDFTVEERIFDQSFTRESAEYLFHEVANGKGQVISKEGAELINGFNAHLKKTNKELNYEKSIKPLENYPRNKYLVIRDWASGFVRSTGNEELIQYEEELTSLLLLNHYDTRFIVNESNSKEIKNMAGSHPVIVDDCYHLDFHKFQNKLKFFVDQSVPKYAKYLELKSKVIEDGRKDLRLTEFQPKVLTSFVRNKLINEVFLPVIGDNLAKQLGAAGDSKRTDLMGLLLLISPPGYGKTTLMEYIANRMGLIFMKINGPTVGHEVTSLDPSEAGNAGAREEVQKLNLALEMGDNVMIYLDDIQHCNPEFLQKFISLCDAQRKIEGVWEGRPRTYDLKGRKVAVVMAGNPYTESGEKFKIPDMLSNRADTYNLGDVVGGNANAFKASYIENAVTSNPVLQQLSNKSQKDIQTFIEIGETGSREAANFESNYSVAEINEIVSVMQKMVIVRNFLLDVNLEYIRSAAMADEFRTEPRFQLQGSYRNMNRLAEKILPILNDQEVDELVIDHYKSESQTLTTGAEANLLKFKEMFSLLSQEEEVRWNEIKKTFKRNQLLGSTDQSDPVGRVVAQLTSFQEGLGSIQTTLEQKLNPEKTKDLSIDLNPLVEQLGCIGEKLASSMANSVEGNLKKNEQQVSLELTSEINNKFELIKKEILNLKNDIRDANQEQKNTDQPILKSSEVEEKFKKLNDGLTNIKAKIEKFPNDELGKFKDEFEKQLNTKLEPITKNIDEIKNLHQEEWPKELELKGKQVEKIEQLVMEISSLVSQKPSSVPAILRALINKYDLDSKGNPEKNKSSDQVKNDSKLKEVLERFKK